MMAVREPYLTQTVVFGMHQYWQPGDDSSVYFVDEARGIRRMLVDTQGRIQHFPGVIPHKSWIGQVSPSAWKPQIRFRTSFESRGSGWIMLWEIQPDGRYWADDDGFGMEHDSEVTLYTYVNRDGKFTGPFRVYEVGDRPYTLDRFEYALEHWYFQDLEKLREGNLETTHMQKPEDLLFPRLRKTPAHFYSDWDRYCFWGKDEAMAYWKHPLLSKGLVTATETLLATPKPIQEIGSYRCRACIQASMTLFYRMTGKDLFKAVLDRFFDGELDPATEKKLDEV